jgi:hypothetical protein
MIHMILLVWLWQVGLGVIPNIWKNKIHVPNHQPAWLYTQFSMRAIFGRALKSAYAQFPSALSG